MRTLTATAATQAAQNLGTEPIIIVKIEWDGGDEYYSEKTFTLGTGSAGISAQGKLVDFNPVQVLKKVDSVGEAGGVTLILDDTDESLKAIVNTEVIEGKSVTVYQHFEGALVSDLTTLLVGKITGGIGWSESERTLAITIDSSIEDKEVGFAPDEDDLTDINPDAVDVPWPLCIGSVVHVPAVRVKHEPTGKLDVGINHNFSSFKVKGGDLFPQSPTLVYIHINNIRYYGSFVGELFRVKSRNLAHHTNILFANRLANDIHVNDPSVAWINEDTVITGLYCYVETREGYAVNQCISQEGRKCFFLEPWGVHSFGIVKHVVLGLGEDIEETAGIPRSSWSVDFIIESLSIPYTLAMTGEVINLVDGLTIVRRGRWALISGAKVILKVAYDNLYICNLVPSTEILAVYGYRQIDDQKVFVPIPSTYYTKTLSGSLAGQTATYLEFATALEEYEDENWEGSVYVTLRSSIGSNVAQLIEWLLTTYSNLTVDASFAAVAAKVGQYPVNFAIFDQPNVLKLVEEIAWQARCAVVIREGVASIIYLSELIVADVTLDEDDLELKTLELGFSETDDIVTKLTGNWLKDYSEEPDSTRRVIYKNNISLFNLVEEERDFFIYNNANLVKLSVFFWGYRWSNSWRKVAYKTFLDTLALEPFDTVGHDIGILSTNELRGTIEDTSQDSNEQSITIKAELASKAGDSDAGQPIEDLGYYLGDPTYPVDIWNNPVEVSDPVDGFEEVDYTIPHDTNDGTGDNTGGDEEVPPPDAKFFIVIVEYVDPVERGVAFDFRVELRDVQDKVVGLNVTASLELQTSGGDSLDVLSIPLVSGIFEGQLTIDGGAGQETGAIIVSAENYEADETAIFDIVPPLGNLVFVGPIPNVARETGQAALKILSGGSLDDVMDVSLNTSAGDKLYTSGGVQITSVTADGAGEFFLPLNWNIKGGQGNVLGQLVFKDTTQLLYNDIQSNNFNITGSTKITVAHSIDFEQEAIGNQPSLDLVPPNFVSNLYPFELEVQYLYSDGSIDTSFNGDVDIYVFDDAGDPLTGLAWNFAGDDMVILGNRVIVTLVSGEWSYADCSLQIPSGETEIILSAVATNPSLSDLETIPVGDPFFSIAFEAVQYIERGVACDMTVTARNPDGSVETDYEIINDPDIKIVSGDSDAISPVKMGSSDWVDGVKTVSITITGGTGTDEATITVEEVNRIGTAEVAVVSTGAPTIVILVRSSEYEFSGSASYGSGLTDCDPVAISEFYGMQIDSLYNLKGDSSLAASGSPGSLKSLEDFSGFANMSDSLKIHRARFTLTAPQKAAALSASLRVMGNGLYETFAGVPSYSNYANRYKISVDITENLAKYANGLEVYNGDVIASWNCATLVDKLVKWGKTPAVAGSEIYLTIPVSVIQGFAGLTFDVWISILPILGPFEKPTSWCGYTNVLKSVFNVINVMLYS